VGPHPAVAEVRRAVRTALTADRAQSAELPRCVLVACSGGADSLALAAATAFEAPRAGYAAGLTCVDHGLQPSSAEQAARVAAVGYELGFDPVQTVRVRVGTAGGPEAAARSARYQVLAATADALGARVLLGHTLDDQAETVLLGLGRGSGPRSIAGMRPVDGRYLRPFLQLRRSTTAAACEALGLQPWSDPQNSDAAFQRVRLRREVLPLLEDVLQGGVAEALARTAQLIRADLDALDGLVALEGVDGLVALDGVDGLDDRPASQLDVDAVALLPAALRTRVLRAWAAGAGAGTLTATHTAALDALVADWHGQGPIDLPGGLRAFRASGRLGIEAQPGRNPAPASPPTAPGRSDLGCPNSTQTSRP
jgi:tRNA(Ile)-lysidine synthase